MTAIDDNAAHAGSMSTDPFGTAMCHNVGTHLEGSRKIAPHAKRIVNDQRDPMAVRNFCNGSNVRHTVFRVGDRLDVDGASVLINGLVNLRRVVSMYPFDVNLELLHVYPELIVGATVQPAGTDEVLTWLATVGDCHELKIDLVS